MSAEVVGHLPEAVLAGLQRDHLGAGGHALQQLFRVLDAGVDEDDGMLGGAGMAAGVRSCAVS